MSDFPSPSVQERFEAAIKQAIKEREDALAAADPDEVPVEVVTDWFIAYAGMNRCEEAPAGVSHVHGYGNSDSSPQAVYGVAKLGIAKLADDLGGAAE